MTDCQWGLATGVVLLLAAFGLGMIAGAMVNALAVWRDDRRSEGEGR